MTQGESDNEFNSGRAELYETLAHPTRILILQTLSNHQMGFSELKRATSIESSGNLSFHLNKLSPLVKTDSEGNYGLTDEGREALRMIEASRTPHTEPGPSRPVFRLLQRRGVLAGLVLILVVLIAVSALFGYTYVTSANTISSLNKRDSGLDAYSATANATIATDNARIAADNSLISKLQGNISSFQSQVSQGQSAIQSSKNQLSQDNSTIQSLENEVSLLQSQVSELQARALCGSVITTNVTLSSNIGPCSGDGLIIGASHITLNCAGHNITGAASNYGISITGRTGVAVKDCNVTEFSVGFFLFASNGNTLTGNTANNNTNYGFSLGDSSSDTFTGNTADNNSTSFYVTFDPVYYGTGFGLDSSKSNTPTGNTANLSVSSGFYIYNSSLNTFSKNMAKDCDFGFHLFNSSSNAFSSDAANNNVYEGFNLDNSNSNTLTGNTADSNIGAGFWLYGSSSNTLTKNAAKGNDLGGFALYNSSNSNTLTGNTADSNNPGDGFVLYNSSSSNTLTGNTANSNGYYGYYDGTTGSGTKGTANLYSGDKCSNNNAGGSSPSGLGAPQS